jgi:hypothetical protein
MKIISKHLTSRIGLSLGLATFVTAGGCSAAPDDAESAAQATGESASALVATPALNGPVIGPIGPVGPVAPLSPCFVFNGHEICRIGNPGDYSLPNGGSVDIDLGTRPGGTTLQIDNCGASTTGDATLTILRGGVAATAPSTSGCGTSTGVFATVSARMTNQSLVARVSCAGACAGTLRWSSTFDFNGDLIDVPGLAGAIPDSAGASLLGLNDQNPSRIGASSEYDDWFCQDHHQSIVRLTGNRFAMTSDTGPSGQLFLFGIGSKPVNDLDRLGTNNGGSSSAAPPANDVLITDLSGIGAGRGHLSGAARSGNFVITGSEYDDDQSGTSTGGLISVIDTSNNNLIKVNSYTHQGVQGSIFGNDGAAWASSAKLNTTANVPPVLRDAHLFVAAGTDMKFLNFVVKTRNPTTQLSSLGSSDPFVAFARVPWSGSGVYTDDGEHSFPGSEFIPASNNGTLITQADGSVYLLTLNGSDENKNVPYQSCTGNGFGEYTLYRLVFQGQPLPHHGTCTKTICTVIVYSRTIHTNNYVSMVKAAGSYVVPTGNAATEKLVVYGASGVKVDNWVRVEEF